MEKQGVTWSHVDIEMLQAFGGLQDAVDVCACLVTGQDMVDAAQAMGSPQNLKATILPGRRIDGYHDAAEIREEQTILVPISIVLMPGPGATGFGVLENHFGMVVIDFSIQEEFDGIDDPSASGEHSVNAIAWVIPQGESDIIALPVIHCGRSEVHRLVMAGGFTEHPDFIFREKIPQDNESILMVLGMVS